jgi:peptidyl-prolyl cis-trans isomerase B (cyclophilin B)
VSTDRIKRDRLRQFEARQVINQRRKARLRQDQWRWTTAAVLAVALSGFGLWAYGAIGPGAPDRAPSPALSENREWTGEIDMGVVVLGVTLDGVNAPQAVANFVDLANKGFYETTVCHRLTSGGLFVLQCGDPLGLGSGGPGYTFGPVENDPEDDLYPAGTIAMARTSNNPESMGSQFFVVYEDSVIPSDLAGGYTIFGQVTSGLDEFIEQFVAPGTVDGSTDGRPAAIAPITSITIR